MFIFWLFSKLWHEEHLQYSFWSEAIFWTASEALALWSQQQKVAKTTSKSLSLSNSSQKLPFFAVLMYALYGHPRYFNSTARVSRLSFRFLWLCLHWWAWIDQKQLCSGEHFWTFSEDPSERESLFLLKANSSIDVFLECPWSSQKSYFVEHLWTAEAYLEPGRRLRWSFFK